MTCKPNSATLGALTTIIGLRTGCHVSTLADDGERAGGGRKARQGARGGGGRCW